MNKDKISRKLKEKKILKKKSGDDQGYNWGGGGGGVTRISKADQGYNWGGGGVTRISMRGDGQLLERGHLQRGETV